MLREKLDENVARITRKLKNADKVIPKFICVKEGRVILNTTKHHVT